MYGFLAPLSIKPDYRIPLSVSFTLSIPCFSMLLYFLSIVMCAEIMLNFYADLLGMCVCGIAPCHSGTGLLCVI